MQLLSGEEYGPGNPGEVEPLCSAAAAPDDCDLQERRVVLSEHQRISRSKVVLQRLGRILILVKMYAKYISFRIEEGRY